MLYLEYSWQCRCGNQVGGFSDSAPVSVDPKGVACAAMVITLNPRMKPLTAGRRGVTINSKYAERRSAQRNGLYLRSE